MAGSVPNSNDLAERLAAVEDRLAIYTLIASHPPSADTAFAEYTRDVYLPDGVFDRAPNLESVPTEASLLLAMNAAARTIPLALFALGAIYKQATPALLILGALAGAMQLPDAGIGLFEHDLGKCAGPLFVAVLQFFVVYLLHRSVITPQTKRG